MARFILIHGAWHGGWCWSRVVPLLEALGHRVDAPDLPSHGDDMRPAAGITLEDYAERIRTVVEGSSEPVVLVGHSMGGLVVSRVSELVPEQVALGIYLSAILPSLDDSALAPVASKQLRENLQPSEDSSVLRFAVDGARDVFYGHCTDEDVEFAINRLCAQSASVLATSPKVTPERFGSVPRAYVECLDDNALPLEGQREMYENVGFEHVYSIDSDHSPFFSKPDELASILHGAVRAIV